MSSDCNVKKTLPDLVVDVENENEETNLSSHYEDHLCPDDNPINAPECQEAGPSQPNNILSNKQLSYDEQKSKSETKSTSKRTQLNNSKGNGKTYTKPGSSQRSMRLCEQHTFLTDITEVRQMEQGLLKLLDDFHSGKLQAFGKDSTFEKMEHVREQQERLARLHFELNAQQEIYGPQSDEARSVGRENLGKLIENLNHLSRSIEQLQISSPSVQTDV